MTRTGLGICRNTYKKINKLELWPSCFIEVPKITYSVFLGWTLIIINVHPKKTEYFFNTVNYDYDISLWSIFTTHEL